MPATDDIEEARQLAKEGKYEAALEIFQAAGGTEGYYGAAACLYRLGRFAEAEEELSHCFELDPQHEKALSLVERVRGERQRAESATETAEARKKAKRTRNVAIGCLACLALLIILIFVFLTYVW